MDVQFAASIPESGAPGQVNLQVQLALIPVFPVRPAGGYLAFSVPLALPVAEGFCEFRDHRKLQFISLLVILSRGRTEALLFSTRAGTGIENTLWQIDKCLTPAHKYITIEAMAQEISQEHSCVSEEALFMENGSEGHTTR